MSINEISMSDDIEHYMLSDVIGQDEAINELQTYMQIKKNSSISNHWKIKQPKGLLFVGPPGVGKTMSVRAFANELSDEATLVELNYSDIGSVWYDGAVLKLNKKFDTIKKYSKTKSIIVFIDEIDSFLPRRDDRQIHNETLKIVNTFLTWLDGGLEKINNITIIGATNGLERMDKAAIRPGRFDKIIEFKELDVKSIIKAFESHLRKYKLDKDQLVVEDWSSLEEVLQKENLPGAAIPSVINSLLNKKAMEHNNNQKLFPMCNWDDPKVKPKPLLVGDFIAGISNYLNSKHHKNSPSYEKECKEQCYEKI